MVGNAPVVWLLDPNEKDEFWAVNVLLVVAIEVAAGAAVAGFEAMAPKMLFVGCGCPNTNPPAAAGNFDEALLSIRSVFDRFFALAT